MSENQTNDLPVAVRIEIVKAASELLSMVGYSDGNHTIRRANELSVFLSTVLPTDLYNKVVTANHMAKEKSPMLVAIDLRKWAGFVPGDDDNVAWFLYPAVAAPSSAEQIQG